jgi:hypothetical protein
MILWTYLAMELPANLEKHVSISSMELVFSDALLWDMLFWINIMAGLDYVFTLLLPSM